jgi:hypothetical protein
MTAPVVGTRATLTCSSGSAPSTPAPWTPGNPMVLVGGAPIVTQTSTCTCTWTGVISVTLPGQTTVVS